MNKVKQKYTLEQDIRLEPGNHYKHHLYGRCYQAIQISVFDELYQIYVKAIKMST